MRVRGYSLIQGARKLPLECPNPRHTEVQRVYRNKWHQETSWVYRNLRTAPGDFMRVPQSMVGRGVVGIPPSTAQWGTTGVFRPTAWRGSMGVPWYTERWDSIIICVFRKIEAPWWQQQIWFLCVFWKSQNQFWRSFALTSSVGSIFSGG